MSFILQFLNFPTGIKGFKQQGQLIQVCIIYPFKYWNSIYGIPSNYLGPFLHSTNYLNAKQIKQKI